MRFWTRFFSLLLALVCVAGILTACRPKQPDETPTATPSETPKPEEPERFLTLADGKSSQYKVIRPTETTQAVKDAAVKMREGLRTYAPALWLEEDFLIKGQTPGNYEILIGQTNREESDQALKGAKYDDVVVTMIGEKLVINSYNDEKLEGAVEKVLAALKNENGKVLLSNKSTFAERATYPLSDITLNGTSLKDYRIVTKAKPHAFVKNGVERLQKAIIAASGFYLPIITDSTEATGKEIVVGESKRPASTGTDVSEIGAYTYIIKNSDGNVVVCASDNDYTLSQALDALTKMVGSGKIEETKMTLDNCITPMLTSFCFTDTHNCFSMLEPPYIFRKNAQAAIDYLLETTGQVDVVLEGGDFMSDYPSWNSSGHLPYEYYLGFKKMATERYAKLAKGGKVMYVAGNHDYAQGEESTDGPGKNGSYNSSEFYFTGPMKETLGELADDEKFEIVGTHTGEKYLLAYHYVINGVDFVGLSPDPDRVWSAQSYGFNTASLNWLKNKLNEIDPEGIKPIFMLCHYAMSQRGTDVELNTPYSDHIITDAMMPVLKGHHNLFYMFGHWASYVSFHTDFTVKNVMHYNVMGNIFNIKGDETDSTAVASYDKRYFTAVWMGGFRLDHDTHMYFNNDIPYGYGGYTQQQSFPSAATPKLAQGMYIEVFPDRVVFTMKNFGTWEGFQTGTQLEPYTVYLYK